MKHCGVQGGVDIIHSLKHCGVRALVLEADEVWQQNNSSSDTCSVQMHQNLQKRKIIRKKLLLSYTILVFTILGNGPNMVSGSTVSNTELSEFVGAH